MSQISPSLPFVAGHDASFVGAVRPTTAPPLFTRIARGEDVAFRELIAKYGNLVFGVARRMLRDRRDYEDACQDIFLALWRSASSYDPAMGDEATFVTMIARRRLIDWQRAAGARPHFVAELPQAAVPATLDSYVDARRAADALGELDEDRRRIVLLAALHGFTHEEISRELSIPLGTVKSHYARAIERVKRALSPETSGRR